MVVAPPTRSCRRAGSAPWPRRVPALLAGLLLGSGIGCGPASDPAPAPTTGLQRPTAEVARREAWRETLRARLGPAYDAPVPFDGSVRFDRGAELYSLLCAGCHGASGAGDGPVSDQLAVPPGDLTDPREAAFWSDRARLEILRHGSPGTPMLGWLETLGERDLSAVYKYVAHLIPEAR